MVHFGLSTRFWPREGQGLVLFVLAIVFPWCLFDGWMIVAACVGILSLNRILSMPFWSLKGLLFGWFLYTHPVPCHLARLGTCFPHPQHPTLTLGARHALTLPTNKAVCFHGAAWFLLFHLLGMSLPLASWQTPRHPSLVLNPSFRCVRPPSRGPLPRSISN